MQNKDIFDQHDLKCLLLYNKAFIVLGQCRTWKDMDVQASINLSMCLSTCVQQFSSR